MDTPKRRATSASAPHGAGDSSDAQRPRSRPTTEESPGGARPKQRLKQHRDAAAEQRAAVDRLAGRMRFNAHKRHEYAAANAAHPREGQAFTPEDPAAGASTITEGRPSDKVGSGSPVVGKNAAGTSLERVRVDATGRRLTTNQVVPVVAYEPNSLGGGCPFQAGSAGFVPFAEPLAGGEHTVRGKAERFADHYTQATLFWNSQTPAEKAHIVGAFRLELSRVQAAAVRTRMVSGLLNVAPELAEAVAAGLGTTRGDTLTLHARLDASPSVLYDAVVLPDGADAVARLAMEGRVMDFMQEQYRHGKPLLILGSAASLLGTAGVPQALPSGEPDPGVGLSGAGTNAEVDAFLAALARHRVVDRENDGG